MIDGFVVLGFCVGILSGCGLLWNAAHKAGYSLGYADGLKHGIAEGVRRVGSWSLSDSPPPVCGKPPPDGRGGEGCELQQGHELYGIGCRASTWGTSTTTVAVGEKGSS